MAAHVTKSFAEPISTFCFLLTFRWATTIVVRVIPYTAFMLDYRNTEQLPIVSECLSLKAFCCSSRALIRQIIRRRLSRQQQPKIYTANEKKNTEQDSNQPVVIKIDTLRYESLSLSLTRRFDLMSEEKKITFLNGNRPHSFCINTVIQ